MKISTLIISAALAVPVAIIGGAVLQSVDHAKLAPALAHNSDVATASGQALGQAVEAEARTAKSAIAGALKLAPEGLSVSASGTPTTSTTVAGVIKGK
jgi:hypothetical protein